MMSRVWRRKFSLFKDKLRFKKNISEALKNRGPISEETRKKLSEALRKRHENAPLSKKSLKKQRKNLIDLILSFLY
jgi:DNA-binding LacI/PurR family transcriptional regulator